MTALSGAESPLRERSFVLYWLARVFTASGFQMQSVAVAWQIYELTGSAVDLGLIGLMQFVPRVLLISVAGYVADRYDRRRVVLLAQAVQAFALAILTLASATHEVTRWLVFTLMVVTGAARSFEMPATQALLAGLVAREALPRAVASSAAAMQAATIAAPALAGVLYVAGVGVVYGITTTLFGLAAAFTFAIRVVGERRRLTGTGFEAFIEGLRFIRSRKIVLGAISLDLFAVLLGGATALLPILARDVLATGPWGLGLLRASPAIGALGMSVWLSRRPLQGSVGRIMFVSVGVFGLATIAFGLSTSLPLSMFVLAVAGAADMISVVIRSALVQLQTPDEMRGRVSAVNSVFIGASNQLGEFESGMTAAWWGAVPAVVVGGLGTLVVVAIWMRAYPELVRADRLH